MRRHVPPSCTTTEQAAWDGAETGRRYAETRAEAYSAMADDEVGVNDQAAARHDAMAGRFRADAEAHARTQAAILECAKARRSAPAPVAVHLAPRHAELAYVQQHQPPTYALNDSEVRSLLGTDRTGLAALEQAGTLRPVTGAGSGRVAMYGLGDVARVAGAAPAGTSEADELRDAANEYGLDRLEREHERAFYEEAERETALERIAA